MRAQWATLKVRGTQWATEDVKHPEGDRDTINFKHPVGDRDWDCFWQLGVEEKYRHPVGDEVYFKSWNPESWNPDKSR